MYTDHATDAAAVLPMVTAAWSQYDPVGLRVTVAAEQDNHI